MMRWRYAGGRATSTLRALMQRSRSDPAWALRTETSPQDLVVLESAVASPLEGAARRIHVRDAPFGWR